MNPPALDHAAPSYQQWVTPELGLNTTRSKGNPRIGLGYKVSRKDFVSRNPLTSTTYSPSFPRYMSHPRECAPCLLDSASTTTLPFQGFSKRSDKKFQSTTTVVRLNLGKSLPQQPLSPGENCSQAWQSASSVQLPSQSSQGNNNNKIEYGLW